ncbi:MAG: TonB-dependent receptor [Anaerolineales bacterium]|jgi:TonB-dependent receptor|nr:TonB-dependent receptor [Anaerolineales bacterium]|tara:strand:+ start:1914 stop:4697 length:2784 start_codon:yes stop_codon:yes gene_type:complete
MIQIGMKQVAVTMMALALITGSVFAQDKGIVSGRVTDSRTGFYLRGANVIVEGSNIGTATDRSGYFRIANVATGEQTINVTYIGYEATLVNVTVESGVDVSVDLSLTPSILVGEGVSVTGLLQGQRKALSQQKTATNISSVVSSELMNTFPDLNTADVLQRVSGVNVQKSHGEGRFIFIRGTEPRMTSVTVNGEKIATPEDEERYVALDVISSNQLSSITVSKTLLPDMDGDAIGGTVNLETLSAFDVPGTVTNVMFSGGYNTLSAAPNYKSGVNFSKRYGKLGLALSTNYQRAVRQTQDNEARWDADEDDVTGELSNFRLDDMELMDYANDRTRYGFTGRIDFVQDDNNRYNFGVMYNKRNDYQNRNVFRVRIGKGDYVNDTDIEDARAVRYMKERMEEQTITVLNGGGKNAIGNMNIDYNFAYSFGMQDKAAPKGQIAPEFELRGVNLTVGDIHSDSPTLEFTNLDVADVYDPSNYKLDAWDWRSENTTNTDVIAGVNISMPVDIGNISTTMKVGGKYHLVTKDREDDRVKFKWKGDDDLMMTDFAGDDLGDDWQGGNYKFGPGFDVDALRDFFNDNQAEGKLEGSIRYDEKFGELYDATENITAAYGMTTVNMGALMFIGGVRYEGTATNYTGTLLNYDADGDYLDHSQVTEEKDYSHVLPNIQARYAFDSNTNIRFAFTTGVARANYFNLIPYVWQYPEDNEMIRGNSDLVATTASNIDFLFEHYLGGVGIISGGYFSKALDDIIYTSTFEEDIAGETWEVEQPVNGGSASLVGYELNWMQQFTFLPGVLGNFGVYANYTHTIAKDVELTSRDRTDQLPGQAADAGNLAIVFQNEKINTRLAWNYNGEYIDEVGKTADWDEWRGSELQLDFSSAYNLTPTLTVNFEANNLTDERRRDYYGVSTRIKQHDMYGRTIYCGLNWNL